MARTWGASYHAVAITAQGKPAYGAAPAGLLHHAVVVEERLHSASQVTRRSRATRSRATRSSRRTRSRDTPSKVMSTLHPHHQLPLASNIFSFLLTGYGAPPAGYPGAPPAGYPGAPPPGAARSTSRFLIPTHKQGTLRAPLPPTMPPKADQALLPRQWWCRTSQAAQRAAWQHGARVVNETIVCGSAHRAPSCSLAALCCCLCMDAVF